MTLMQVKSKRFHVIRSLAGFRTAETCHFGHVGNGAKLCVCKSGIIRQLMIHQAFTHDRDYESSCDSRIANHNRIAI